MPPNESVPQYLLSLVPGTEGLKSPLCKNSWDLTTSSDPEDRETGISGGHLQTEGERSVLIPIKLGASRRQEKVNKYWL